MNLELVGNLVNINCTKIESFKELKSTEFKAGEVCFTETNNIQDRLNTAC